MVVQFGVQSHQKPIPETSIQNFGLALRRSNVTRMLYTLVGVKMLLPLLIRQPLVFLPQVYKWPEISIAAF